MSSRSDHQPAGPLTSVLRHPALVSACLVAGLVLGLLAAFLSPRTYTAESRVAVVPANTNAYTVAGYPVGARELAADYARWVQNRATEGAWAPAGVGTVTASPIPDSAVIRVETEADSADAAVKGADQIAQELIGSVTEAKKAHDPEAAYREYQSYTPKVAAARAKVAELQSAFGRARAGSARDAANKDLQAAQGELDAIMLQQGAAGDLYRKLFVDAAGNSTLKVVAPAAAQGDPFRSSLLRYGIVGLGAGALLGLLLAVLADRRRGSVAARRADRSEGSTAANA